MLVDEARRIAAAVEERLNASGCQGAKATVKKDEVSPKSVPAGAGRPTFISYFIQINDDTRTADLTLGQAAGLIDDPEGLSSVHRMPLPMPLAEITGWLPRNGNV